MKNQRVSRVSDAGGSQLPKNISGFEIEKRAIDKLVPFARNSRTHSDAQITQIAASMREWGFTSPILVDENDTILAGHGRLSAAKKLGLTEVPVICARGWSEAQKRAYVIADNKIAMNSGWDTDLLALELQDLSQAGFDVTATGFDGDELAGLLGDLKVPEANEAPEAAADEVKYLILVEVADESEQAKLFDELQTRGMSCRVMN